MPSTPPVTRSLLLGPSLATLGPHRLGTVAVPAGSLAPDRRDTRSAASGDVAAARGSGPASSQDLDGLAPFTRLVAALRWLALVVSGALLVSVDRTPEATDLAVLAGCVSWTGFRTLAPIRRMRGDRRGDAALLIELILATLAVLPTGAWESPFVPLLLPGVAVAGLAWGGALVGLVALAEALVVAAIDVVRHEQAGTLTPAWAVPTLRGIGELVLVALLAGFGRHIIVEVEERRSAADDNVSRLSEANTLLYSLHQVAQSLPASLDLEDVLASTVDNTRALFETQVVAVLLDDETSPSWVVGRVSGLRLPSALTPEQLPPGVQLALRLGRVVSLADLPPEQRRGLAPTVGSGVYAPLKAREHVVAVLVSEHPDPGHDGPAVVELMGQFAEPASLALDNARWFARLRTVAADEERGRIARDLHDRIGQMLAYLGFELDRLSKQAREGGAQPVAGQLDKLRIDVRRVVSEVRETLYDLRTDVSDGHGLVPTLQSFLDRVAARTGMAVTFVHEDDKVRLPLRSERELWRIAQEAVTNVERHANATRLEVRWWGDDDGAHLEVEDDGKGFGAGEGRVDSYGMRGIRERAAAINARLDIASEPGRGTVVRCRLPMRIAAPGTAAAPGPNAHPVPSHR